MIDFTAETTTDFAGSLTIATDVVLVDAVPATYRITADWDYGEPGSRAVAAASIRLISWGGRYSRRIAVALAGEKAIQNEEKANFEAWIDLSSSDDATNWADFVYAQRQ